MHSLRNYLLIMLVFLCSSSLLKAQCLDPVPVFQFTPNNACSGSALTFEVINLSTANDETYSWVFGDGTTTPDTKLTANGSKVTYAYNHTGPGPGNFTVVVRRVKGFCVYDSAPQTVTVKPQVVFLPPTITNSESTGGNVCVPDSTQNISVTATLTNPNTTATGITGYQVNWGNGQVNNYSLAEFTGTSTLTSPIAYTTEGAYPITVTANSSDPNVCPATVVIPFNIGRDPKAVFSVEKKERITPQFPAPLCGVPVKVTLKNESTGGGLTYKWEITNSQPGGPTNFSFIEGTTDTTKNPILQFNEKGQYKIKLTVTNPCVTASDPVGPIVPFDPENPDNDFDEDGKYVQEEQVIIVYPQIQIQGRQLCEDLTPGQPLVIMGNQLGQFDLNLGTLRPGSITWTVTGGATVDNPNIENPQITFPGPGTYTVAAKFANDCEFSDALPGASQRPPATITITARPPKPADGAVTLCSGESYVIQPTGSAGARFNFYTTPSGGTPVAADTTAYPISSVSNPVSYYIAAILNGCESPRAEFKLNVLPAITNNNIQTPQSICAGATPAPLTGTQPAGANGSFSYTWILSASATGPFSVAPGVNNGSGYAPTALAQSTFFRRVVTSASCKPDTSAAVEITVVPLIANNTISQDQIICAGTPVATLIGTRPTGGNPDEGYAIIWESSTTSATAGFAPATGVNGAPVIINEENFDPGAITQPTWYRRLVTSAGCSGYSNVIQVTVAPALAQNTIGTSQTLCANATPAALTGSTPIGGTGTYTYLWESSTTSATAGFGPASGSNNGISYSSGALTQPVTYFRRVVTSGSCEPLISEVVTITVTPAIDNNTITAAKTVVCEGTVPVLTGTIPTGGNGALVYLWESSVTGATAGFNPAIGTNNTKDFTPGSVVQNTWYRRTVTTAGSNCPPVVSNVIAVTIDKLPAAPTVEAADVRICAGTSATLRVTSNDAGTYQWFTTETGGSPVSFEPVFVTPILTENIVYYVQATNTNQCVSVARTPVKVTVTAISAEAGRDTTIIEGTPFALQATGGTTYVWSPATGLNNPNVATPIATPTKTTTYQVTVTTEDGCTATDEVTITVIPRVVVVNTFSPNGDNINETWEIQNIQNYPNASVEIFNRWGNQVFKSEGTYVPWDGTYKGNALPLATYYYIILLDRNVKPISGSITIIR